MKAYKIDLTKRAFVLLNPAMPINHVCQVYKLWQDNVRPATMQETEFNALSVAEKRKMLSNVA